MGQEVVVMIDYGNMDSQTEGMLVRSYMEHVAGLHEGDSGEEIVFFKCSVKDAECILGHMQEFGFEDGGKIGVSFFKDSPQDLVSLICNDLKLLCGFYPWSQEDTFGPEVFNRVFHQVEGSNFLLGRTPSKPQLKLIQ